MTVPIRPQGAPGAIADGFVQPLMYAFQGNARALPQRTHRWNNHHLKGDFRWLSPEAAVELTVGDPNLWPGLLDPLTRHAPILGGRPNLLVVDRREYCPEPWFIGWSWRAGQLGVSRIPLFGPVRVTIGAGSCSFFGFTVAGQQVSISEIGRCTIRDPRPWEHTPLL